MVAQRQALTPFTLTSRVAFSPSAGSMRGVLLLMCFAGILEELTEFTAAQPTYSKPTAGNLKIAVTDAAIAPVVPMFLKLLTNVVGNIKVPQQELSGVKLEEMQVHDIQFGNMSIKMVGNELLVSLWNITAAVPEARFDYDLFLISCSGKARTDVRDANASLKLMLSIGGDNLPIVTVEDMVVRFLNLAIVPTLEGWCKPADIIANILMKIFERGIVDYLQKHVPVVIEPLVKTLMVDTIRRLPITIVNPPNISDGRMELS
ncbi:unnamed protein product [Trypanosoma congolense IL3000]|uniref:WGS project CAEQ00000000 data, annotated contig 929 n=1 Tax=Trypanosoma congolense (strain IL3000) TaxID=1068625 RepID=F9WJM5_TRYCI|nr:unnamed protein product [Trypanosoma congolense IL3000]